MEYIQTLLPNPNVNIEEQDNLDIYVGVTTPISAPFNVFVRQDDLMDDDNNYVYFYAYSIGDRRIVLWGVYNKETNKFTIDEQCRWQDRFLTDALKEWAAHNYTFGYSTTSNKITRRMNLTGLSLTMEEAMSEYTSYKHVFLAALVDDNVVQPRDISEPGFEQFYKNLNPRIDIFDLLGLKKESIYDHMRMLYTSSRLSKDDLQLFNILADYGLNREDAFILTYSCVLGDLYNYRMAKYLMRTFELSDSDSNKSVLQNYVNGSYFGSFLNGIVLKYGLSDEDNFYLNFLPTYIQSMETAVNTSAIGVLGDRGHNPAVGRRLKVVSDEFQEYIAKTKYSKLSYYRSLADCPSFSECQTDREFSSNPRVLTDPLCGAYYHSPSDVPSSNLLV